MSRLIRHLGLLVLTVLVICVTGGTTLAVTLTAQHWIYSYAQSGLESEFRAQTSSMNGAFVSDISSSEIYGLLRQYHDITALDRHDYLLSLGTVRPEQIPKDVIAQVDDNGVHSKQVGTHRVILGTRIWLHTLNREDPNSRQMEPVQLFTARPIPGIRDKLERLAVIALICFLIAAVVCIAIGMWLSNLIVAPLKRLDRAVRQAAQGDSNAECQRAGARAGHPHS